MNQADKKRLQKSKQEKERRKELHAKSLKEATSSRKGPKIKLKVKRANNPVKRVRTHYKLPPAMDQVVRNNATPGCPMCRSTGVTRWGTKGLRTFAVLCSCVKKAIKRTEQQMQEVKSAVEQQLLEKGEDRGHDEGGPEGLPQEEVSRPEGLADLGGGVPDQLPALSGGGSQS